VYLGLAAFSAGATCLVARFLWPRLMELGYAGQWPVADALIIAWALAYPDRQIYAYFVLPLSGRALIYLTVGGTALYAIFRGVDGFVPHFLAQAGIFLYARGFSPGRLWMRARFWILERTSARRRAKHLRVIERDDKPK